MATAAIPSKAQIEEAVRILAEGAKAYSDAPDHTGHASRAHVIACAKSLIRSVVTPDMMPNYHGLNMAELIAIRTFIKLRVLDAIPTQGSISLQDLSRATGVQDSLLERMARVLVASGFLDQTRRDGGDYVHTEFSRAYLLDEPGPGHLFLAMQEGTPVWAIMSQDPERFRTFQTGMAGLNVAVPPTGHFGFDALRNSPEEASAGRVQLVDVGGGQGDVLNKILAAYPGDLVPGNCVLQDRPEVIELSKAYGVLPDAVQRLEHDFMTEQPVKGAKAYFMRMILHDYADDVGVQILARLAAAMALDSRVLICEMLLPQRVGEADFPAAVMDQAVMSMGGKERTERGFASMLDAAGLELVKVWRVPGVPGACIEGGLKQT